MEGRGSVPATPDLELPMMKRYEEEQHAADNSAMSVSLDVLNDSDDAACTRNVGGGARVVLFYAVGVACVLLVLGVAAWAATFAWSSFHAHADTGDRIAFDDIFNGRFSPRSFEPRWISEGTENDDAMIERRKSSTDGRYFLARFAVNTDGEGPVLAESIFLPAEHFVQSASLFFVSPDARYVVFASNVDQLYRHSYFADFTIVRVADGATTSLPSATTSEQRVRLVQWSPRSNAIAFVQHNNLYVHVLSESTFANSVLSPDRIIAVTSDGQWNAVLNGAPDWLYEEEVLEGNSAVWWSPDGQRLAYLRFDESDVKEYTIPLWNDWAPYPEYFSYKYPCVGETNSIASLRVVDVMSERAPCESGRCPTTTVEIPRSWQVQQDQGGYYIPEVTWAASDRLVFRLLARSQRKQELFMFEIGTSSVRSIKSDVRTQGWLEPHKALRFAMAPSGLYPDGVFLDVVVAGDRYRLALCDGGMGGVIEYLSPEGVDVQDVLAVSDSPDGALVLFSISEPTYDRQLVLASVRSSGEGMQVDTSVMKGDDGAGYYDASCSDHLRYCVVHYEGPGIPSSRLFAVHRAEAGHVKWDFLSTLEDNGALRDEVAAHAMPEKKYMTIPVNGEELPTMLILPPNFDEHSQHPLLMHAYGGPNSQQVSSRFSAPSNWVFHAHLASTYGVVVAVVDGRGTCCKGDSFLSATDRRLGVLESDDQRDAAKYFASLSYIDKDRIGFWGWSFGGFLASTLALKAGDAFSFTMAVAPVAKFEYYDSAYTERFMLTTAENEAGYAESAVLSHLDEMDDDTDFLLVHGTADDNVHFQNTLLLSEALIQRGVQFETAMYPNRNHGIYGGNTRRHLFEKLRNFVLKQFALDVIPDSAKRRRSTDDKFVSERERHRTRSLPDEACAVNDDWSLTGRHDLPVGLDWRRTALSEWRRQREQA